MDYPAVLHAAPDLPHIQHLYDRPPYRTPRCGEGTALANVTTRCNRFNL
jgi:hypothetical protein